MIEKNNPPIKLSDTLQQTIAEYQENDCAEAKRIVQQLEDVISEMIVNFDTSGADAREVQRLQLFDTLKRDIKSFIV